MSEVKGNVVELSPEQRLAKIYKRNRKHYGPMVKDYILDDKSKKLIHTGETNIDDKIQSHADCALDKILDTFMDPRLGGQVPIIPAASDNVIGDATSSMDDKLDMQLKAYAHFENLKRKYGLDPSLSYKEVVDFLSSSNKKVNDKLKEALKKNEKISFKQESKLEELHKNSAEDSSKES